MLAVGSIAALTMGAVGITTEAFAPDVTMIQELQQALDKVQIVDQSEMVDGLTREERIAKVAAYFETYNMPAAQYAESFVRYADEYGVDWTLVPAIAFLESSGFRNSCKSATFSGLGWGSCKINFSSYDESIRIVTMNLAGHNPKTARYYADKTPYEILNAYNPKYVPGISKNYHGNALEIMSEIKVLHVPTQLAYTP